MATVTRENIGKLHDKLTVELSKDDYMPSFEKQLKSYAKSVNMPGFRKGMVPTGMVRKMYGPSIFNDEVFRTAGTKLEDYLKEHQLPIFAQPMAMAGDEPLKLDMNDPSEVKISFEIGLKPELEVESVIKGATLNKPVVAVSDSMVNDEIARLQKRHGEVEEQDAIENNENVVYTNLELCDEKGNVAEGTEPVEDTELMEKYPAKLNEQLMGKKKGESIVFQPSAVCTEEELADFLKHSLKAGEEAKDNFYKLTITKVTKVTPSELGEKLYEQVFPGSELKTEEDFTNRIKEELAREFDRVGNERMQNDIYELLVHNVSMELPVDFLKRWMKEGGEKPRSDEEVEQEYSTFDHQLRWTLISDKLLVDYGIEVSREEVMEDIKARVLAYFGMTPDMAGETPWMDEYMAKVVQDEKTMDETYRRLLYNKLFAELVTKFNVTEQEVPEEEFFKQPDPHAAHAH